MDFSFSPEEQALPPSPLAPLPRGGRGELENKTKYLIRAAASRSTREAILGASRDLRRRQTPSERLLWEALRNRKLLGRKFRRQARIGHCVADFYCPTERLVVEVDGGIHRQRRHADRDREQMLE